MVIVIFRADLVSAINSSFSPQKDLHQGKIELRQNSLVLAMYSYFRDIIQYHKVLSIRAIAGVVSLGPEILS